MNKDPPNENINSALRVLYKRKLNAETKRNNTRGILKRFTNSAGGLLTRATDYVPSLPKSKFVIEELLPEMTDFGLILFKASNGVTLTPAELAKFGKYVFKYGSKLQPKEKDKTAILEEKIKELTDRMSRMEELLKPKLNETRNKRNRS